MKGFIAIFLVAIIFFASIASAFARSGCCSRHQGVCGCGCCDGTPLSSTCAPYYPGCSGGNSSNSNYVAPIYLPTNTPVPPTATPYPTNTPMPTETPIPTITSTPIVNSANNTQEVAGASSSSNSGIGPTILVLILILGVIGFVYKSRNKSQKT